jgi:hypothetical protein
MKHRGGGSAKQRHAEGLSLSAFAGAKASTYDKRARLEKERALNAKKARPRASSQARGVAQCGAPAQGLQAQRSWQPLRAL